MAKSIWKHVTALALSAIVVGAAITTANPAPSVNAAEPIVNGKITVNGKGSIKVKPDIAYVNLGVRTENVDAKEAQAANNAVMTKLVAVLKALGIKDEDIQTSGYSIYPSYDYSAKGEARVIGYSVNNNVSVTVRNINNVGEVIDNAVAAGANTAGGIQFSIADTNAYYAQALAQAVLNAKSKSIALANALGVTVGTPTEIIENGGSYLPVAYAEAENYAMKDAALSASMPVQTGELEVVANITAVFTY